jgi:formylglycine-generating enzyme required for sulfatase activity
MTVKAGALGLSGYRLPVEVEWVLACRAGSVTTWSIGEAEDLLPKYAWYSANSPNTARATGRLRPNDLGLFDQHGNVWEWCHNQWEDFAGRKDGNIDDKVDSISNRSARGGAFNSHPLFLRSAFRFRYAPASRGISLGFRPARTFR